MKPRMDQITLLCQVSGKTFSSIAVQVLQFFYDFVNENLVGWVRGRDPTRLLHYEGGGSRTSSTDIVCPMYMRVWDILKIANDPSENRPLILCEYGNCGVCHMFT